MNGFLPVTKEEMIAKMSKVDSKDLKNSEKNLNIMIKNSWFEVKE